MASDRLTRTYDPDKVIVTFGGVPIGGYAEGTFISVKANSDLYTKKVGADGEIARGRKHNNTHNVTLTLMQTSASNTYLQTIENMDRLANMGIRPLVITDLSGGSLHSWPQAWINKDPDADYGDDVGSRAWAFETGHSAAQNINGDFIPG
jgi:hypothetical protein